MEQKNARMDNRGDDGVDNKFKPPSSLLLDHDSRINAEDETGSPFEMQPVIKMEVFTDFPTMIELNNESVPKLEPNEQNNLQELDIEENDINDNDMYAEAHEEQSQSAPVIASYFNSTLRQRCTYCGFFSTANSISMATHSMEMHLTRYHPEHFFPEERDKASAAGMTLEEFQKILVDNLLPKFMSRNGNIVTCSLCSREYSSRTSASNRNMMQKHLVCTHQKQLKKRLQPILKRRLLKLERSRSSFSPHKIPVKVNEIVGTEVIEVPSYSSIQPPAPISTQNNGKTWSSNCGFQEVNFSDFQAQVSESESGIETEDVNHDQDPLGEIGLLSDETPEGFGNETPAQAEPSSDFGCGSRRPKCIYCGLLFYNATPSLECISMERHHVRYHPQHYFPEESETAELYGWKEEEFQKLLVDTLLPQVISKTDNFYSCTLCPKKKNLNSKNQDTIQKHVVFKHKMEMKKKINEFIKLGPIPEKTKKGTKSVTAKRTGTKKAASRSKDSFMSDFKSCLRPSSGISKCPYCDTPCGIAKLKQHKMEFHPELYFRKEADKALASGLTTKQFQQILMDNLFAQCAIRAGKLRNCAFCDVFFNGKNSGSDCSRVALQKHLIDSHKLELKERLKLILKGL